LCRAGPPSSSAFGLPGKTSRVPTRRRLLCHRTGMCCPPRHSISYPAREVIESILANLSRFCLETNPSARDLPLPSPTGSNGSVLPPNPAAIAIPGGASHREPRHYSTTITGTAYGQSSSGQVRVWPRDYTQLYSTPMSYLCRLPCTTVTPPITTTYPPTRCLWRLWPAQYQMATYPTLLVVVCAPFPPCHSL